MSLPRALVELVLGWLHTREIQASKTTCRAWSSCLVVREACFEPPCPRVFRLARVQTIAMDADDCPRLELGQLSALKEVSLKLDCCKDSHTPRSLYDILQGGEFAGLLAHLDLNFALYHRQILSLVLALPKLRSLVLRSVFGSAKITASARCPLERIVFEDCSADMDLTFTQSLQRLRVLGFTERIRLCNGLAALVPRRVQAQITELELDMGCMVVGRRGDLDFSYYPLDLTGYCGLRRLDLKSGDRSYAASIVSDAVDAMPSLQALERCDWSVPGLTSLVLTSLVLPASLRLESLPRCLGLRTLTLVSCSVEREFPVELLPPGLESLELVGFWPSRPVSFSTVRLGCSSFAQMSPEDQARMRASVKNLYVS